MKYGVREITDVVFRAKADVQIGSKTFRAGQPVLYLDSAKTSTLEQASTTVYATGGRGNTRLIAWEGEKTLTFTVEDALISPIGISVLSGAGLIPAAGEKVHFHMSTMAYAAATDGAIDLADILNESDVICEDAPLFVMGVDADGSLTGELFEGATVAEQKITCAAAKGKTVMVDYYVLKPAATNPEIQITADNFAGYYYVEANTLFRKQIDGTDAPVNITLPNVKIQSNFTFSMASSGDPSTFTFTMDAFPGYTYFNKNKKVLCVMQVVDETVVANAGVEPVMGHDDAETLDAEFEDSLKK